VQSLPPFEDMEDKEDPIYWSGPVLVEDRLLVTGSNGVALAFSPYTGRLLGKQTLPTGRICRRSLPTRPSICFPTTPI
jgi:hypothetical protein